MNQTEILKYLEGQKTTRTITDLIVHCTATKPGAKVNVDVIDGWHKERGFKKQPQSGRICGYHFVVLPDGTIETGRYLSEIGAHVSGQNSRSIGICYVGDWMPTAKPPTHARRNKRGVIMVAYAVSRYVPGRND